jgi:cytochrome b
MKKTLIYDLPTRLFHWVFAALFIGAYGLANTMEDESVFFSFHMLIGLTMFSAVILRLIWGFVGSPYAKFSSFKLSPGLIIQYFKDLFAKKGKLFAGHNPASSWSAIVMMLLALVMAVTGTLMATGTKGIHELHEVMAHVFLAVVIMHVLGIILHTILQRDPIALSMVGGYKNLENTENIKSSHPIVALVFIGIVGYVATQVFTQFDPKTRTLTIIGKTLQLGEDEKGESGHSHDTDEQAQPDHDED